MKKILWLISLRNILNIIFSYIISLNFYLNVGVLENKEGMISTNIKLKDALISKGYTVDFEYFNSGHDYLSWWETLGISIILMIKRLSFIEDG